jgi:hypothetical protein
MLVGVVMLEVITVLCSLHIMCSTLVDLPLYAMMILVNILSSSAELLLVIVNILLSSASDREKTIPLLLPSLKPPHWNTSPSTSSPVYDAVIVSVAPYATVDEELSSYLIAGSEVEEHEVDIAVEVTIAPLIEAIIMGVIIFLFQNLFFITLLLIISRMVHI